MKDVVIKINLDIQNLKEVIKQYNFSLTENKLSYNLIKNIFEYNKNNYSNDLLYYGMSRIDGKPIFTIKNFNISTSFSIKEIISNSFELHNLQINDIYLVPIIEDHIPEFKSFMIQNI